MPIRLRTIYGLWASVALIILNTAALLFSLQWSRVENADVHHTRDVQMALSQTWDLMQDAEAGHRGFLLTGSDNFLEPCKDIEGKANASIQHLRAITRDNPEQQRNLDILQQLVAERLGIMLHNIELRRTQSLAATVASVSTEQGRMAMSRVQRKIESMQAVEQELLTARERKAATAHNAISLILLFGSAGLFLLVAISAVAIQREMREREEAQQRQREIADRLSVTLASIGDAVITTDALGRVTFVNLIAAQATGWTHVTADGVNCSEVFRILDEATREPVESPVDRVIRDGEIVGLVNHTILVSKDGREINIDDSAAPIRDSQGRLMGVILVFRDITERRLAEKELDERVRLASLSGEVGTALTESDSLSVMLERCAAAFVHHLDASFARIWTLNKQSDTLELQASAGMYTHLNGPHSRIRVGQNKIGRIASERQPHLTNSVVGDPEVNDQEWAVREGMVAFAGYPLIVSDRLVGVAAIFARHELSETVAQSMGSVADQIALGIERKLDEEALYRSDERLRAALVASETGTLRWDFSTDLMEWDNNLDQLLGRCGAETERGYRSFVESVHPDDRGIVADSLEKCRRESADLDIEFRVEAGDGAVRWLVGKGKTTCTVTGKPIYMTGACMDVTQRKQIQAEIEDLNSRLKRAMAESHHRIKNNLQMLAALVDMQYMNGNELVPAAELERLGRQIRTLASLHDLLTAEAKFGGDTDTVPLSEALSKLVTMLRQTVTDRHITLRAAEIQLPLKKCGPFILIANELVSNAIKHGKGDITITLIRGQDPNGVETVALEVADRGPGFPSSFDPTISANTGLELIESMGRWDLAGEVLYRNRAEGGALVRVTFPITETANPEAQNERAPEREVAATARE